MSEREYAKILIDQVPEDRLDYIIALIKDSVNEEEIPNAETLAAFAEIENGGGITFRGTIDEFIDEMMRDDDADN